ncbi:MAG: hypothetical protein JNJ45_05440 [Chthonomonas sp.]|nr:hypothetical protein [Chthonomonas sp.]
MSTRSFIGRKVDFGFEAIYCHFDGYLAGVGTTLLKHYTTDEKVKQLLELGDISSLGSEIGEKHDFDNKTEETANWTRAYHRDRGEEFRSRISFNTLKEFVDCAKESWAEYIYLWDGTDWFVSTGGTFISLKTKLGAPLEAANV